MLREAFERMIKNNIYPKGVEDFKARMSVLFAIGSLGQDDYLYLVGLMNPQTSQQGQGSNEPVGAHPLDTPVA